MTRYHGLSWLEIMLASVSLLAALLIAVDARADDAGVRAFQQQHFEARALTPASMRTVSRAVRSAPRLSISNRNQMRSAVIAAAHAQNFDVSYALAITQQESGFNPRAIGPHTRWGRAIGGMQLLCSTARGLGFSGPCADLTDPALNAKLGVAYLAQGARRYGTAWACRFHHGGPNEALHGVKTMRYCAAVQAHWRRYAGEMPTFVQFQMQPFFALPAGEWRS